MVRGQVFVKDLWGVEIGDPDGDIATGVMGNIYAYDRDLVCDHNGEEWNFAVSSVHLGIGWGNTPGGLQYYYAEAGLYYVGNSSQNPEFFGSWYYYPRHEVRSTTTRYQNERWYGFNVSPIGTTSSGTNWKMQYSNGEFQNNWITYAQTNVLPIENWGTPKAEMEHTPYSSGETFIRELKYRPSSGWSYWRHMGCDHTINEPSWDVYKFTESSFYMRPQPPEPGGC